MWRALGQFFSGFFKMMVNPDLWSQRKAKFERNTDEKKDLRTERNRKRTEKAERRADRQERKTEKRK